MENGTHRSAPRAFYPDFMQWIPLEAKTPGWDSGPERRMDHGRTLRRVLGWASVGVAALGLALPRGRAHTSRLVGALMLIAGVAAIDILQTYQRSWSRAYDSGSESE